jgi:hypothetical protein
MRAFAELTGREKRIEVLRWFCVLPSALLGGFVVQLLVGVVVQIIGLRGSGSLGASDVAYSLSMFLAYMPAKSALVIAGATMAPRRRMATALVLTFLAIVFSLLTHVVSQHLAGNRVGFVNYLHFSAESVGALIGAAFILFKVRKQQTGPTV